MGKTESDYLAPFRLLPPAKDVCKKCAVAHDPRYPHDRNSLFYQYSFYNRHGRWPTWKDAMEHCDQAIKETWTEALREHGIEI